MSDNNNDLNRGTEIILRFAAQELPDVIPELDPIQARILKTHLEEAANSFASGELTIRDKNGGELHRKKIWQ